MAEILGISAGAISLADVALRVGKELCALFADLEEAPREAKVLVSDVNEITNILRDIQIVYNAASNGSLTIKDGTSLQGLLGVFQICQAELNNLQRSVNYFVPKAPNAYDLAWRLKWVLRYKDRLKKSHDRLNNLKLSLTVSLSALSLWDTAPPPV